MRSRQTGFLNRSTSRTAEATLGASGERLPPEFRALAAVQVPVVVVTRDGRVAFANPATLRLVTGTTPSRPALVGANWFTEIGPREQVRHVGPNGQPRAEGGERDARAFAEGGILTTTPTSLRLVDSEEPAPEASPAGDSSQGGVIEWSYAPLVDTRWCVVTGRPVPLSRTSQPPYFQSVASPDRHDKPAGPRNRAPNSELVATLQGARDLIEAIGREIPGYLYVQRPDYTIEYCNPRFEELFGSPSGRRCHEVLHGRDAPCPECPTFTVFETRTRREWEWEHAGRTYLIQDSYIPHFHGGPAVLEVGIDVTRARALERDLHESQQDLRALLDASPETLFLISPDGKLLTANDALFQALGHAREQMLGRAIYDFLPPAVAARRRQYVTHVIKTKQPLRFEDEREGRFLEHYISPILNTEHQVSRLAVMALDISPHKRVIRRLRAKEAHFHALFQEAPVGFCQVELPELQKFLDDDQILPATRAALETRGEIPGALVNWIQTHPLRVNARPLQLFSARDWAEIRANHEHLLTAETWRAILAVGERLQRGHISGEVQTEIRTLLGRTRQILVSTHLIPGGVDEAVPERLLIAVSDITQLKRKEAKARASERAFRALASNLPALVFRLRLDPPRDLTFVNDRVEALTGYAELPRARSVGSILQALIVPDDQPAVIATLQEAIRDENAYEQNYRIRTRSGQLRWLHERGQVLRDPGAGGARHVNGVILDVTTYKEAKFALVENEERMARERDQLRGILDAIGQPISVMDPATHEVLFSNSATQTLFPTVHAGTLAHDIFHFRPRTPEWEFHDDTLDRDYLARQEDVWWEDAPARLIHATDVTILKRAVEQLRVFKKFVETAGKGFCMATLDLQITYINQTACDMGGKPNPSALIGKNVLEFFPEEVRDNFDFDALVEAGGQWTGEVPLLGAAGELIPTLQNIFIIPDDHGQPACLANVITDLRWQKRAEGALRESEARYRAIIEDQSELICRFHDSGIINFVNHAYCEYFGKTRAELVGHTFFPAVHPDDQVHLERQLQQLGPDHPVVHVEHRVLKPDGSVRWQHWTNHAIFDEAGHLREVQAVGRDITARRVAQEELREHASMLALVLSQVPAIIWTCDEALRVTSLQGAVFGHVPPETYLGRTVVDILATTPEHPIVRAHHEALHGTPSNYEVVYEGRPHFLRVEPFHDAHGRIQGLLGLAHDISSLRQTQVALEASDAKFRDVFMESPVAMALLDDAGDLATFNQAFADLFGLVSTDQFQYNVFEDPTLPGEFKHRIRETPRCSLEMSLDFQALTDAGILPSRRDDTVIVQYRVYRFQHLDPRDDIRYLLHVTVLTETKRALRHLQESEAKFRALAEESSMAIIVLHEGRCLYGNAQARAITGFSREEFAHCRLPDLLELIHADDREAIVGLFSREARSAGLGGIPSRLSQEVFRCRLREQHAANHEWLDLQVKPVQYGPINAQMVLARNVSATVQREETQERVNTRLRLISGIISTSLSAPSLEEAVDRILALLLAHLDFNSGGVYLLNEAGTGAILVAHAHIPPEHLAGIQRIDPHAPPYSTLFVEGRPLYFQPYDEEKYHREGTKVATLASVPVKRDGRVMGVINLGCSLRREISGEERAHLESVSEEVGVALRHFRCFSRSRRPDDSQPGT